MKELIDTDGQETQDWTEEIQAQISKLNETFGEQPERPPSLPSMDGKMDQMCRILADMNRNGLQDRDMLLEDINALKNREAMPLHITPLESFPRFHTPMHHHHTRESPLPHQTHLDARAGTNHHPKVAEEENRPRTPARHA